MKSTARQALLLLALTLMLTSAVDAARFEGSISTDIETDMVYVDRFVSQPNEQTIFHYDIKAPANICCSNLVMFRGVEEQWPHMRAMQDEMTCLEKKYLVPGIQNSRMLLLPGVGRPCYYEIDDDGSEIIHCVGKKSYDTNLDRWYYITFMNCYYLRTVGVDVRYKFHVLNGDRYWNREFSADESSMLETTLICGIMLAMLIVVASIFRVQLANKRKLHTTYKIWYVSLILQFIGVVILAFALFNFAVDGYERSNTKLTGHIFTSIGNVIFTTVLILMGKGYTITRLDIRRLGVAKIIVFVLTYSATFLTLYVLKEKADKRDVKNIYDSEAAVGLVILRFIGLGWILYGVFFTMKNYPKKRAFYLAFTTFAVVWFLSEPLIILLSNYHLPLYCRAKVIHGVYLFVAVLGHAMFLFLTRPSTTNTFFPFHLSTNKVGFEVTDEESLTPNSGYESDSSCTKYMVEKERAMDYERTVENPSTVRTISESVSKQDVKISTNTQETPKPTSLTPLQKVFRALEEVDRSIEEDRAAELAQRKKLQSILGFPIGGTFDLQSGLSEENISPCDEVTDATFSGRNSNNLVKSAAEKDINTATPLTENDSPSKKKITTKEEAAKIKAKELEDIFVTSRHKEIKSTHGGSNSPAKTCTVDTLPSSSKTQNKHLQSSSKAVTSTTSNSPSLTSEKGETKGVSASRVHSLPYEPKVPSPTSGQGDINHLQDYTKTTANAITDPKIIVTKKNKVPRVKLHAYHETRTKEELKELFVTSEKVKPTTSDDAGQTVTEVNSFDEVTYTPVMPFKPDSDQDMSSLSSPSTVPVKVKRNKHQLHSTPVRGTDHKVNYSSTVKTFKPPAQDYRLRLGLRPTGENIKKNELQTAISFEDESSDEPEFESTVIQPATNNTGLSDPFGCGQVGLEIPGKRWVQENLLRDAPSIPAFNQLEVLPPENTHHSTVQKFENEVVLPSAKNANAITNNQQNVRQKESFARRQYRQMHMIGSEYDNMPVTRHKVQHHEQSTSVLKVENEMEQLSSHKTQHSQHSNGVVKTLNKLEQLPQAQQNKQHHMQSTTVCKVENEMEHPSPGKSQFRKMHRIGNEVEYEPVTRQNTQHHMQSTTVCKVENEMEHLSPGKSQFRKMHRIGNEVGYEPVTRQNTQHHMQSTTVLKVENEMEQLPSHKTKHHQHSNGVVKTLNKLEQLSPAQQNTPHHVQSTTVLKVENEMEQKSSHKNKSHQHSNGVVKTLNRLEQLPQTIVKSTAVSSNTSNYSPSSHHRDVTRAQNFAHGASARHNVYEAQAAGPAYNTATNRELVREVDETPQSKEECLERLRQLRDELTVAERLEQKMNVSDTTSESSLGSVPDEERGDTKKKKKRNPIHKARKMLGKKKHSEQGGQMQNC